MSAFFETTLAPPPDVRCLPKKKSINSKKQKASAYEDSTISRQRFCQYHRKCNYSTDECTTFDALIKKAESNKSKGYRKAGENMFTSHKVNVLIKKTLEKSFKQKKGHKQELCTFEKMDVSESEQFGQSFDNINASIKSNGSWKLC